MSEQALQLAQEIYLYLNETYGYDVDIDDLKNIIESNIQLGMYDGDLDG